MLAVVTGGFGFIGSNLVTRLLDLGFTVKVIDDLSTGDIRFLSEPVRKSIEFHNLDLRGVDSNSLSQVIKSADIVFHLAANADVRGGFASPYRDLESNIVATLNVLEAMRIAKVPEIVFSSTGCVYGDTLVQPTPEEYAFPIQTSLYGNSKVAAEGMISTYASNGVFKASSFRFVSILGRNYHHGHVIDFVRNLLKNPARLQILGDGRQKKSYLHVDDCVSAMIEIKHDSSYEAFNLGNSDFISVLDSAQIISKKMNLNPELIVGNSPRGWVGDNPFTFLDISKARRFNWTPTIGIRESLEDTVEFLLGNQWLLLKEDYRLSIM